MADVHSIQIKVDSTDVNRATGDLNKMSGATSNAEKALGNLIGVAKGLVAFETLRRVSLYAIEAADSFTLMSSKLKLATSSQDEFKKAQDALFKIAQANNTELASTVDLFARLSRGMKEAGNSQSDVLKMTNAVNQALKISGATASETSSVITQFGQALGSGVLRGEEFNAIMENGNRLARALADGLGVPLGSLRKLAEQGKLTGDIVTKAILSQTDALSQEAAVMDTTVGQAWTNLQNAITQYIGEANDATGASKDLANAILTIAEAFQTGSKSGSVFASIIQTLQQSFAGGRGALMEYVDLINAASDAWIKLTGRTPKTPGADPEMQRAMDLGTGKVPIDELAAKTNQAVEKSAHKAGAALETVAKKAKKTADDSQRAFEAVIQANISAAEDAAKLQDAIAKTAEMRLENELDAAKEKARLESKDVESQEEKIRIAEELAAKQEEIITKETELRLQALAREEEILNKRILGVEQEIEAAGRFNLAQSERIRLETELASLQTQKAIIPEQRTQIDLQAIKELSHAHQDLNELRTTGEENVREEALRTLAVMESNLDFAREMATGFADAFGEMGEAIGGVVVSLAEYEKQMATIKVQMDEEIAKNPAKRFEIEQKAAEKTAKAQINAYGDMTQSAQKFFKQGTKGYEAMGAATKVFRAFEVAQSIMSVGKQMSAQGGLFEFLNQSLINMGIISAQQTQQQIAESQQKQVENAVEGAAKQGTDGDVYTAFARVAAWVALMAGLGIAISGGGGSAPPPAPPPEPGTGTVLGNSKEQSKSIENALDLLVDINSNDLAYSAAMLKALIDIKNGLAEASKIVSASIMPLVERIVGMAGVGSEIEAAGLIGNKQLLQKILDSGFMSGGMGYRKVTTTDMMIGQFKSVDEQVTKWPKKLGDAFGRIVTSMYEAIQLAGKEIGLTADTIAQRAKDFEVNLGRINLAGKSGSEAAEAMEAAFSAMGDKMAKQLLPEFADFNQTGEGMFETVVRVSAGIADARGKLEQLGMTAIDFTQITEKNGDVAAEIARQTLMAQGQLGEGGRKYVEELTGSIDDILEAYGQLVDIQNSLRVLGVSADEMTRTMINAAGGLSAFQEALTTFIDEFMTPVDKIKGQGYALSDSFERLGVAMPKTRDEFKDLILGIDRTGEAGQKLYGQLIALSPAFADYIAGVEDLNGSLKDLFDSIADLNDDIFSQIASLKGASAEAERAAGNVAQAWADLQTYFAGVTDNSARDLDAELDMLSKLKGSVMANYNAQMALLREAAQAEAQAIKEAASAQVQAIKDTAAEQQAAIRDQADAQIDAIKSQLDADLDARKKVHDAALEGLQEELDAANKLKAAVEQVKNFAAGMALGGSSPLSPEAMLNEAQRQYQSLLQKAQGGDAEAIGQLSGAADQYLQQARRYFGSGTQYANVFDGVKKAMESIGGMSVADPDSIQSKIDALRESQEAELKGLREAADAQTKQIREESQSQIEAIKKAADEQAKAIQAAADAQAKAITDPEQNEAMKQLKNETIAELERIWLYSNEVESEARKRQKETMDLQNLEYVESKNHTSILAGILEAVGGTSSEATTDNGSSVATSGSGINSTMQAVANETRASVNVQKEAFPKMIERLEAIGDRLAKIERLQRISA